MTPTGNVERFERLFTDHIDAVLGYALARVDPETAKDAAAETFLVAWRRLDNVPDPARSWLLGVTRRTLAGQRRGRRRQYRLVERIARTWVGSELSDESMDRVADRSVVIVALNKLRAPDRELLCMVAWDGLDNTEAAAVLGCSTKTLAVRLHRARVRLESALTAEQELPKTRGRSADPSGFDRYGGNQIKEMNRDET
jgi:RNA polymerase sigma factor (sigma-70 family)